MRKIIMSLSALLLLLSACASNVQQTTAAPSASPFPSLSPSAAITASSPSPSPSTPPSPQTMSIAVYYLKEGRGESYLVREVHGIEKTEGVAKAALAELISGKVSTSGAYRVLPADTRILGVKIENGLATVDFSKEVLKANVGAAAEELGIKSIVNTLTEFPTIQKVQFTVEGSANAAKDWWGHVGLVGQPFVRDLNKVYEPVIWVTSPEPGQKISKQFNLQGSARIFEATVNYRLKDNAGQVLAQGYVTASAGAPDRGDFSKTISFSSSSPGSGQLEVFEASMKDGSDLNKVIIPLTW